MFNLVEAAVILLLFLIITDFRASILNLRILIIY